MSENNSNQEFHKHLRNIMESRIIALQRDGLITVEERDFFEEQFLIPMEKTTEEKKYRSLESLAMACTGGCAVGLMPSECYRSLVKIGDSMGLWAKETSDQNNLGEKWFWSVCFLLFFICSIDIHCLSDSQYTDVTKDIIESLDNALEDVLLPRKMSVAALQVKITCNIGQAEYDKALIDLVSLEEYLRLPISKRNTISYMGYTSALRDYDMHVELDRLIQIDILKEEFEEALPAPNGTELLHGKGIISLDASMLLFRGIELFSQKNKEIFEQISEKMSIDKREILSAVSPSHEKVRIDLISHYGSWVNELSNQGALVNAEFLYEALNKRTWGGVVTEYSSAVEAEIKNKLIEPFIRFLISRHGQNILLVKSIPPLKVRYDISLFDIESLFTISETESVDLKDFLSNFSSEIHLFIINELPKALKQIRELRNPPSHGVVVSAQSAKTIRSLIIGESLQKPGILKKLAEIKKVS